MYNYTFITPYTLQVTYDNYNLQKITDSFCNKSVENVRKLSSEPFFSEKYISGYSNILNVINKNNKVYFSLPQHFNENTVLQFVKDFLIACTYANLDFIVFDRTRCSEYTTSCNKILMLCQHIEEMFIDSGLPIIYVESNLHMERKGQLHLTKCPNFKFHKLYTGEINPIELNSLFKLIHEFLDFKETIFSLSKNYSYKGRSHNNKKELKYSYTLN